jgi:uncharacterized protein YfaQ (DUF2300 family)
VTLGSVTLPRKVAVADLSASPRTVPAAACQAVMV